MNAKQKKIKVTRFRLQYFLGVGIKVINNKFLYKCFSVSDL